MNPTTVQHVQEPPNDTTVAYVHENASTGSFEIKDAISLMIQQTTLVNALWGIYAAASFTAAGFGLNVDPAKILRPNIILLLVFCGFGVFLVGHWKMLKATLRSNEILAEEIRNIINKPQQDIHFIRTIRRLVDGSYSIGMSFLAHILIDICSMSILIINFSFAGFKADLISLPWPLPGLPHGE